MARWHHWLDGRESEWTPGVGDGQGGLACCNSWVRKESDTTEQLNWVKFTYSSPSLFPRMSTFTLAISCLTTFNLPWFMDLTFQVPIQYCSLQHRTLLASITSHIRNWVLFLFWLHSFILSGVFSPLISSSILGTYWSGEFLFQYPIILPFYTVHGFSRQEYWSGLLFLSPVDHILSDLSTMPACLGWPHRAWLSFIELDKAVVRVIRLANFLWLWFQCVCPLMPSRNTYCPTWVSLTLDVGYLFTAAPAKRSCCSLT